MVIPSLEPTLLDAPPADACRFRALFAANARAVLGYALRRTASPEDAADVVADTFLVAWRRLTEVPEGSGARAWLFGVARRVLANHRRGEKRRDRLGGAVAAELRQLRPPAGHGSPTDDLVLEALGHLGVDDRELLTLSSWEGLTPSELALIFDIPATTARTRLRRARQRLRRELELLGLNGGGDR